MKPKIILLLCFAVPLFCMAQRQLVVMYDYDAAGNRILRKMVNLEINDSPPAPEPPTAELTPQNVEYFVEKISQVEIKIYPNPATEKITLAISEWDYLQTGIFKLYTLSGQLLQEQPVHSSTTIVSLAGLAKGAYILKVQINGITEDWKIIKQ
jgi:hypothetical protein